jgi:hypothetical protein
MMLHLYFPPDLKSVSLEYVLTPINAVLNIVDVKISPPIRTTFALVVVRQYSILTLRLLPIFRYVYWHRPALI